MGFPLSEGAKEEKVHCHHPVQIRIDTADLIQVSIVAFGALTLWLGLGWI